MARQLKVSLGQYSNRGRKDINQDFHGACVPHEPQLTRFLRRNWRDPDEVDDLRQEVYARVFDAAAARRPDSAPAAFQNASASSTRTLAGVACRRATKCSTSRSQSPSLPT